MKAYGFFNKYGKGWTDTAGHKIGEVKIFDSKAERDEWVDEAPYTSSGNVGAEAITAAEAKAIMSLEIRRWKGESAKDWSTDEIVDEYKKIIEN
jgi:hypothetical protein